MVALSLSLAISILYLALLRFVDLNEREPLWAVALLFALGFAASGIGALAIPSVTVELTVLPGAAVQELVRFAAIAIGILALEMAGRGRGWSEVSGPMDGIVYGGAAGLGFATGDVFTGELAAGGATFDVGVSFLTLAWTHALAGIAHGVFGALAGLGLAAAARGSGALRRAALAAAGLAIAIAANAGHRWLSWAAPFDGATSVARAWAGLLLPLALVAAVALWALTAERRAIHSELSAEAGDDTVRAEDLALLGAPFRRQRLYLANALSGRFASGMLLRGLHNRQVQLALARRRAATARDETTRVALAREVEMLRTAIRARRAQLETSSRV